MVAGVWVYGVGGQSTQFWILATVVVGVLQVGGAASSVYDPMQVGWGRGEGGSAKWE